VSKAISPNSTIAQYSIVSKIGEGGMGEVYRARDTKLGREVAIKVLPASLSENADRLNRFEQEAQAAGALNHPNILSIHHIGTHNGAPYIVSELLIAADGQMMASSVKTGGKEFQFEAPKPLFKTRTLGFEAIFHEYDVSPDGQRFLIGTLIGDTKAAPPTVIQNNWTAALKK
jgi:protein kinase-like protein